MCAIQYFQSKHLLINWSFLILLLPRTYLGNTEIEFTIKSILSDNGLHQLQTGKMMAYDKLSFTGFCILDLGEVNMPIQVWTQRKYEVASART